MTTLKKLLLSLSISTFPFLGLYAQDLPAYHIFDAKGKKVDYSKMLKAATKSPLVLFGEFHNNPIAHWLQMEMVRDLHKATELRIGMEMFETDQARVLQGYLEGLIDRKSFDTTARLWSNYNTDYAPLIEFAKQENIPAFATNTPRYLASTVYRGGFEALDTLDAGTLQLLPPLPVPYDPDLPGYVKMMEMMPHGHSNANFPKAQAIKDATMAWFILANMANAGTFLHLNGAFHSDFYDGICWYLQAYNPEIKFTTITTVTQSDLKKLDPEHIGRADFIIVVPETMTNTY
jgi:uncharacterized iron-regulated protein